MTVLCHVPLAQTKTKVSINFILAETGGTEESNGGGSAGATAAALFPCLIYYPGVLRSTGAFSN